MSGVTQNGRPWLSIVTVNWNSGDLLRACVESVVQSGPSLPCEFIIVDNASTDDSLPALEHPTVVAWSRWVPIRLIKNAKNVGFARAVNQAIRQSQAPMLFLLNPDTLVRPGAIDALAKTLTSDDRIGACAPRLLNPDGSVQPSVWPNPPTPLYIITEGLQLYRLLPRKLRGEWLLGRHWDHARRRRVRSCSGAAFMVKRALIADIGDLDERFEMYGEDAEWCFRMIRRGWWLVFEPAAEVIHYGGGSAEKRWAPDERRLREVAAHIGFQQECLSPAHVMANTLSYALVLELLRAWRRINRHPIGTLDAVIALQWEAFRQAVRAVRG